MLDAYVGVSQARTAALKIANQPIPPLEKIRALLDTGASCTCIDPSVLQKLGIPPTGNVLMNTPSTGSQPHIANVYDVGLVIPGATSPPLFLHTIAIAETELLVKQGLHALIGRDVLEHFAFYYNGGLKVITVSY